MPVNIKDLNELKQATEDNYGLTKLSNVNETYEGVLREGNSVSPYTFNRTIADSNGYGVSKLATIQDLYDGNLHTGVSISPMILNRFDATVANKGLVKLAPDEITDFTTNDVITVKNIKAMVDKIDMALGQSPRIDNELKKLQDRCTSLENRVKALETKPSFKNSFYKHQRGWFKDESSGMIMQWGWANRTGDYTTVTFPMAFPSACLNVSVSQYTAPSGGSAHNMTVSSFNNRTVVLGMRGAEWRALWIAIGY